MRKKLTIILFVFIIAATVIWFGCSTSPTGDLNRNQAPETYITNVPPSYDTIPAVSLIYWYGVDNDGFVAYYEWYLSSDSMDPSLITDWDSIEATDDTMMLTIDDFDTTQIVIDTMIDTAVVSGDTFIDTLYTWYFNGYFYVRAIDNEGLADPTPAWRGWNVYSEQPRIEIATPDSLSGMLIYMLDGEPEFWGKNDTPMIFILDDTTANWPGVQVWWSRSDTLNQTGNDPIGYRYRIDNGAWSSWTDEDPATAGDSFITFTGPLADGQHKFYLQGRNASHIESEMDSIFFYSLNPNIDDGKVIIALTSGVTYNFNRFWYDTLFQNIRPNINYEIVKREITDPAFTLDDLQGVGLVIYIKDDQTQTGTGIKKDTTVLYQYTQVGGRVWIAGLRMVLDLSGSILGQKIIEEVFGLDYFNNSTANDFVGAIPTQYASSYNMPSDSLWVDQNNTFPPSDTLKFCENFVSSSPNIIPLYSWVGTQPWNETPVAVLNNDQEKGIKVALFGFSPYSMNWNTSNYEPMTTIFDEILNWFGL